jgi:hypothetical protein
VDCLFGDVLIEDQACPECWVAAGEWIRPNGTICHMTDAAVQPHFTPAPHPLQGWARSWNETAKGG